MLDAAGLALFCVTGASTALDHGLAAAPAVILGATTGIGGGILRDILVRHIPVVLREGLYAIPALIGARDRRRSSSRRRPRSCSRDHRRRSLFCDQARGPALGLSLPRAWRSNRD